MISNRLVDCGNPDVFHASPLIWEWHSHYTYAGVILYRFTAVVKVLTKTDIINGSIQKFQVESLILHS